jgi:2-amino-4-hydroxy-6-hydroxymethyldihydropteridine diphosphokinase
VPRVYLGLGANLGDRLDTLQRAVDLLATHGVRAVASSRVWATTPLGGPPDQPEFLNVVVAVDPDEMPPADVLAAANAVEAELGRVRDVRWGPRTIDIDVLLWGDLRSEDPGVDDPAPTHARARVRGDAAARPRPRPRVARRAAVGRARRADGRGTALRAAARGAPTDRTPMAAKLCPALRLGGHDPVDTCPRCGAPLFDRARRRAGRRRASARGGAGSRPAWWFVIAAAAFVTIQRFTPSAPAATTGLQGYLVYPAPEGDQVRLWIWNLATDTAEPGPLVPTTPSSLVSVYSVEDSWLGLTMPTGSHGEAAEVCAARIRTHSSRRSDAALRRVAGGRRVRQLRTHPARPRL